MLTNDETGQYAYERFDEENKFIMLFNLSDELNTIPSSFTNGKKYKEILSINYYDYKMQGRGFVILKDINF